MKRQIRRVEDLPSWFDTDKYTAAVKLNAQGWYRQLAIRQDCHHWVRDRDEYPLDYSPDWEFTPLEFLHEIRRRPICNDYGADIEVYIRLVVMGEDHPSFRWLNFPPGLDPLDDHDIGRIILSWPTDKQDAFLQWLNYMRGEKADKVADTDKRPRLRSPRHPIEIRQTTPVRININFSDEILTQSFDTLLKYLRDKYDTEPETKRKRINTLAEWCNCGLLQYIDLTIWANQNCRSITNKTYAQAIFPRSPEKGEENIRKTTRKHAEIVFGHHNQRETLSMSTLLAHARLEALDPGTDF